MAAKAQAKGQRRKTLPPNYQVGEFDKRENVVRFVQDLARRVLTEHLDPRRVDTALRAASVALNALQAEDQAKLLEALIRMEHGGAAAALLQRLQDGMTGPQRPLPGRRLAIAVTEQSA